MAAEFANMNIISDLMNIVLMECWVSKSNNDGLRNERNWVYPNLLYGWLINTLTWENKEREQ